MARSNASTLADDRSATIEFSAPTSPTPVDDAADTRQAGEFARLIPSNRVARLAFSQVVELVLRYPDDYAHHLKFMHFEKAGDDDSLSEVSDLGEGVRAPSPALRLWNGYYSLDLRVPPANPRLGWALGSASIVGEGALADFLLASKRGLYRVGGRHTVLNLHSDTGCLMALAGPKRSISIAGSFGTIKLLKDTRALTESASISVGDLQYKFEYLKVDEDAHRKELKHFMEDVVGQARFELSGSVSSLGSDADVQLKDYTIKGTFASGTSAMVAGAIVKATGQFVAVKKMRKTSKDDPTIAAEQETLEVIHKNHHQPRICRILELITIGRLLEELYVIYSPFLYGELYSMLLLPRLDDTARITICKQYLEGLAWIHAREIMHRDLKPQNMGLKTIEPPDAVIFDFGHATLDKSSRDHYKGTIWYLAPEVLDLKWRRGRTPYDRAVDIWAMGLTLYQLICRRDDWRGQETVTDTMGRIKDYRLSRLDRVLGRLKQSHLRPTTDVIRQMLEVNPKDRIEARDAMMAIPDQDEDLEMDSQSSKRQKRS